MDFTKVEVFLREHWPAGFIVIVIVVPIVWGIATLWHSERIAVLEMKITDLTSDVGTLTNEVKELREYRIKTEERINSGSLPKIVNAVASFRKDSLKNLR